jgi:HD-like signal output (HDOD) protein
MKNWINRLTSRSDKDPAAAAPVAPASPGRAAGEEAPDLAAEIEAAYYRWLTAARGYTAPSEVKSRILDEVRQLTQQPLEAAGLVPRVPETIPQLLASLRDDDVSVAELARQVSKDVVLLAEVIREANSAYYRPITPVKDAESAIVMLGQNGLRMLVARIAFRPLINMQPTGFAREAAPRIWSQSVSCALAASLMAPGLSTGVFEAYLAGLMQNVGLVVAFRLADRICPDSKVPASSTFGVELLACSRQLSAAIATHWDFPPAVADAIGRAGEPGQDLLAQALTQGDRIAKLRLLVDAGVLSEDGDLVTEGLDNFQRRCLGKLGKLDI